MVALPRDPTETGHRIVEEAQGVFETSVKTADLAQRERHADCMAAIAGARSRAAFAELFGFYAPRLKSYLLRLGAGDAEAEELVQEVMITVWQKEGQYDRSRASVSTWVFRIARNRRIDAQRRLRRPELAAEDTMLR